MKRYSRIAATATVAFTVAFALALAAPARGDAPGDSPAAVTFFTSTFHLSGSTESCGFPVEFTIEGSAKARGFDDGHTENVVNYRFDWIVIGNGKVASLHEAYTETFFPSNAFPEFPIVRSQHGLTWQIRLDGGGVVTLDAGSLVYLIGGDIAVVSGPHPTEVSGGLPAAIATICGALA
jgi:hypothetical protein